LLAACSKDLGLGIDDDTRARGFGDGIDSQHVFYSTGGFWDNEWPSRHESGEVAQARIVMSVRRERNAGVRQVDVDVDVDVSADRDMMIRA
jgi:hypothetical protein